MSEPVESILASEDGIDWVAEQLMALGLASKAEDNSATEPSSENRPSISWEARPPTGALRLAESPAPLKLPAEDNELDRLMAETAKHLRNIGRVNIMIAGQTGVGKSTLLNSVFGESFAATATGKPVTQRAEWFSSDSIPLRILDTKGLEVEDYENTLMDMRAEIERSRQETDTANQLHIGWVCIATPSSRVQNCDVNVVRLLNKYDIPAIIVLTKDDEDPEFAEVVSTVMQERHAKYSAIIPVRALARRNTPAFGLDELTAATYRVLPQAHRAAFAAAQKVNRDLNRAVAEDYVTAAVTAAAAASVIPIPFADIATLIPIQTGMLIGISSAFNLSLDRPQVLRLITTTLGSVAAATAGRWVVGSALKLIPGPGTVLGSMLNAAVAGAMTRTIGLTYVRFLYDFLETNGRVPVADEIMKIFPAFYQNRRSPSDL
jgi:small GTP-binding protein